METEDALGRLKGMADRRRREGMSRYGISVHRALGVSIPQLRSLAKEIGRDHALATTLFGSEVHEAMVLACFVDEPEKVNEAQMDAWVLRIDSWDLCDQCCNDLFRRTPFAWKKAIEWSGRDEEFVKRAGFTLMAVLAVHDKTAVDSDYRKFLSAVDEQSSDGRNFVKKAVNWALRQIGKRNQALNAEAILTAEKIGAKGDISSKWVASDALKELRSEKVQERLKNRGT